MTAAHAQIHAGVCGFVTDVRADLEDEQYIRFEIASPCENIQGLAKKLLRVDAYAEISAGFDGEILRAARVSLKGCCSGCVVPNGIYKAMQVAAGLALPRRVTIEMAKEEEPL